MTARYILALDQGTTSSKAVLFDILGQPVALSQKEFTQIYPQPGWVEHDPSEIWETQLSAIQDVLRQSGVESSQIAAIGITNQRETTVIWDKKTGRPVYNAIVWQCRRTAGLCESLFDHKKAQYIQENTGLLVDAYFSATKIRWLLDHIKNGQSLAEQGDLLFGTIDSWLLWNLSGGQLHITDYSNASRTMLYNIRNLHWDETILSMLAIPPAILPEVRPSCQIYGLTAPGLFPSRIPIASILGDQQAALFGQGCFEEGMVKNTYGTGCFILMQTKDKLVRSQNKLLTTIAWGFDGCVEYALEGSVFIGGAVIQWLRDEIGLLKTSAESEYYASQVPDSNGVYLVPAFVGLGAPYWDMHARGTITGLTRGANRNHIIRAALESIAFQVNDVLSVMKRDTGLAIKHLMADGGGAENKLLMQFQADISEVTIQSSTIKEITALGAAYMAGLAVGFWKDTDELRSIRQKYHRYIPLITAEQRTQLLNGWKKAIACTTAGI